jgi:hypothetical protein
LKIQTISLNKDEKKLKFLNISCGLIRTINSIPKNHIYVVTKTSILDYLRIEILTQVGDFSPLIDSGDPVDHYNDLKSCFLVMNFIVEFNVLSKSGLGMEIGQ